MLETFPDNNHLRYLRGILSQRLGELQQAEQDYQFLINQGGADAAVYNNLGTIFASSKEYEEAMDLFLKATVEMPDLKEARENLALVLMEVKDYDRAIDEYKKAIKLSPDNIIALYNLGAAYLNNGNLIEARAQWEKVLSIKPQHNDAKALLKFIDKKMGSNGQEN